MSQDEAPMTFAQDEIGEAAKPFDLGNYSAKLLDVQVVDNTMGTSLLAIFSITSGPKEGEDLRIYRSLKPYKTKTGGWWVPGLREIKADLAAVDGLPPKEEPLTRDPAAARVQYAKGLARKEVNILVYDESYTKDGENKTVRKKRVSGVAGVKATMAGSSDLNLA